MRRTEYVSEQEPLYPRGPDNHCKRDKLDQTETLVAALAEREMNLPAEHTVFSTAIEGGVPCIL
jgi:hypothetical protein